MRDKTATLNCLKKSHKTSTMKTVSRKKKGKREYLNNQLTRGLMEKLESVFESTVDIPRIKVGKRQTVETLINEEALLFAKYLRNERRNWFPRIGIGNKEFMEKSRYCIC